MKKLKKAPDGLEWKGLKAKHSPQRMHSIFITCSEVEKKVPINILNIFMSFHSIHKIFIGDLKKEYNLFSAKNFGRNFYHRKNFCKNMDFRAFKKVKKWSTIHKNISTEMISKYMCLRAWKRVKNRFTHNSADSDGRNRPIRPI